MRFAKKLLSAALAISMVVSLIPGVVSANDEVLVYDDYAEAGPLDIPIALRHDERLADMYRRARGRADLVVFTTWVYNVNRDGSIVAAPMRPTRANSTPAESKSRLGLVFRGGVEVQQDDAVAEYWFRLASEAGHAGAQFRMALLYDEEYNAGVREALHNLFEWLFINDHDVEEDDMREIDFEFSDDESAQETLRLIRAAADQGLSRAQAVQSLLYEGAWLFKDDTDDWEDLEHMWGLVRDAAEQNLIFSQIHASNWAVGGWFMTPWNSSYWHRRAAELGVSIMQYALAEDYLYGHGHLFLSRDIISAQYWFLAAAIQGVRRGELSNEIWDTYLHELWYDLINY